MTRQMRISSKDQDLVEKYKPLAFPAILAAHSIKSHKPDICKTADPHEFPAQNSDFWVAAPDDEF